MPFFIIDNKKIDLTQDEYKMYEDICLSYDRPPSQKGKDLFVDLFETDENGIMLFLKPPSKRQTSFEIFMFLMSIFQHQHLRLMHKKVDDMCAKMKEKITEIDEKLTNKKNK
jgi:hypothetical protein